MEFIRVTKENIDNEHICCAISNDKDPQVISKKAWLGQRLDEGMQFVKADARGKCFIQYIPAENAWVPINAAGYMYVDCFWVSGQLKGNGYSDELLDICIQDAKSKGMKGLVILSSGKKMPFLSDPKYLKYKGFVLADKADPYFELLYLPFDKPASVPVSIPAFRENVKNPQIQDKGYVLYYSAGCPFTAKYVPLIEKIAREKGLEFKSVEFVSTEQAQAAPSPFTIYSLFYNGKFITNEILSDKKFEKIIEQITE